MLGYYSMGIHYTALALSSFFKLSWPQMIFGYKQLSRIDDWREIVGEKNWVPTRSAYELAHRWHGSSIPMRVKEVFDRGGIPELQSLRLACLYVEHRTFLDTLVAPSCTDIIAHCRTLDDLPLVVGVEGKSTEPFDEPIQETGCFRRRRACHPPV